MNRRQRLQLYVVYFYADLPETRKFPKQVLGETTDDEDYQTGFSGKNPMGAD